MLGLVVVSLAMVTFSCAAGIDGRVRTLRDGAGTLRDGTVDVGTLRDGTVAAGDCTVCGLMVPWRMVMSCWSAAP